MKSLDTFRTERLYAERIQQKHYQPLCKLNSDPHLAVTLGGVQTDEQTMTFLQKQINHFDQAGYGVWILYDKAGNFVGRAGLQQKTIDDTKEIELLYAIMPSFWNKGLATEISQKILTLAFTQLQLSSVVCFTLPTNLASKRVMEKLGFVFEKNITHANLSHIFYRITDHIWTNLHIKTK